MTHENPMTAPFVVVIDTREQLPYTFKNIEVGGKRLNVPTERGTLASGDYSIKGFENLITIERKSVCDFYGSITTGRERLKAEFERMESMQFSAIVVEGRLETVLDSLFHGRRVNPNAIRATVASWSVKYQTRWFFSTSREQGERLVFELLEKFYRYQAIENKKIAPGVAVRGRSLESFEHES